jgi:hypothetical protein
MKTKPRNGVALSPDYRARMARLYEEVTSRLVEMAQVVSRNLEFDGELYPSFTPLGAGHRAHDVKSKKKGRAGQAPKKKKKKKTTLVITDLGEGVSLVCNADHTLCGCYFEDLGMCAPCT